VPGSSGPIPLGPARRPRVAEPLARAPNGRFISAGASYFGRQGAAERERRRFLERPPRLRSADERSGRRFPAIALVRMVSRPP
jgi:hypothetical protein